MFERLREAFECGHLFIQRLEASTIQVIYEAESTVALRILSDVMGI